MKRVTNLFKPFVKTSLACILTIAFVVISALSADNSMGFSVVAIIPENQIDTSKTYFDLRMTPSQEQTLQINVSNTSNEQISVNVKVANASTYDEGIINYKSEGIKDSSMIVAFEDVATVKTPVLEIPANSSSVAEIELSMSESEYDGVVLGGIVLTKIPDEPSDTSNNTQGGVVFENEFSYVIGAVLSENDKVITPDITLEKVSPELVNHRMAIVHSIYNAKPVLMKDVSLKIDISKDGEAMWNVAKENLEIAPSSMMNYPLMLEENILEPGEYLSKVTVNHNDKQWDFEMLFSVASDEASVLNEGNVVSQPEVAPQTTPIWLIIAVTVSVTLLVLAVIVLVLFKIKKKQK